LRNRCNLIISRYNYAVMIKKIIHSLVFVCFLLPILVHAALDLELTQGSDNSIPIAVVPFDTPEISDVVSADLQHSGAFRLMDVSIMPQYPHLASDIDYSFWQKQKINAIAVGKTEMVGGQYKITMQLLDVYNKNVLLDQQFTVNKAQFRALAHKISDLIYQKLTGIRGIFSTKIAYVSVDRNSGKPKYSLMVADADGYNSKRLLTSTEPLMSPTWSPNGKNVAYVSFENERSAIYVQDIATGKRTVLTSFPGINGAPAWSPDGNKIALVLTKTDYPKLYLFDLATHNLEQLTSGVSLDTEPSWAPDGKSLIFTSNMGGVPQVYQITLSNKKINRLTYNGNYNTVASFTPDQKSIVLLNRDGDKFNIAIQNLSSGRMTILANDGINKSPSIAPNGNMIVYATIDIGKNRGMLAEVSVDGKVKLLLPAPEGDVEEPAWSPFLD
jgi:TolB protein